MELKSIVKYNLNSLKKSILIYYSIFITVCICLVLLSNTGNVTTSGLEISSVIFIFVVGLNSFKENFYFMKSNNVSRKDFIYGTAVSMIPVSLFMAFVDIIINRIYNIFIKCPTIYETIYTSFINNNQLSINNWVQNNSIETLFNAFTFQFAMCLALFSLGFLITIIYYKSNKFMKLAVSISPVSIIILLNIIMKFPNLSRRIGMFIEIIFGGKDAKNK